MRRVHHAHGVGLDGDAALALEVHRVQHLRLHLARGQRAGQLQQPVGEGGFAVVDVRDDREVANVAWVHAGGEVPQPSMLPSADAARPQVPGAVTAGAGEQGMQRDIVEEADLQADGDNLPQSTGAARVAQARCIAR